ANAIARWDGQAWHALGTGVNDKVYALAVGPNGSLYVGGRFVDITHAPDADFIARWDGQAWHDLAHEGSVLSASASLLRQLQGSPVRALAVDRDGNLYVGGEFTDAGGNPDADYIARWDGQAWHDVGSGVSGIVHAFAFGPDGNLYVGGEFARAGPPTNPFDFFTFAPSRRPGYVVRWDGRDWHALGTVVDDTVYALAFGPDGSLYVGGYFTNAGGNPDADSVLRWDGRDWHALGEGVSDGVVTTQIAVGSDGVYVSSPSIISNRPSLWFWNGTTWVPMLPPAIDVYDIVIGPDGSLYIGGEFTDAGGNPDADYIARWDGRTWHALGTGVNGNVLAFAVGPDGSLYVGGHFTDAGGNPDADYIARWDGQAWHAVGAGLTETVRALAVGPDGSLYVGGDFTDVAGDAYADYLVCMA
ncbi:two-component regulator propeller domain-containing protein, partial [Chloroflexus sp.]|uniref:two-component regulator propeller domain-containing protein n=1 Tax=Chloroflexus sp. TaxID=1904827 RepID=UPI00404A5257